jgi:glycosyltransferase 2 family protein
MTDAFPVREPEPRRTISTRTVVVGLVIGLPLSALFLWLAFRGVEFGDVWLAIKEAHPALVAAAIPCALLLFPFQGLRWRHLVEATTLPPRPAFVALIFVGGAVTNVVPGRPGDLARGMWLTRLGPVPVARALTSVGVDRAVDVLTLFTYLLVCLPFIDKPDWVVNLVIVGAGLTVLAVIVLAGAWWYSIRSSKGAARLDLGRDDKSWWRHQISGIVRGLAVLSRPRDFGSALTLSFLGWLGPIAAGWLIATALGISLDVLSITFVVGVISLGSAIPASPGMVGTYQWLAVTSMAVVGVGAADALAFSIISQATWYVPVTLSGPFAAWWLTRYERSMPRANIAVPG